MRRLLHILLQILDSLFTALQRMDLVVHELNLLVQSSPFQDVRCIQRHELLVLSGELFQSILMNSKRSFLLNQPLLNAIQLVHFCVGVIELALQVLDSQTLLLELL